MASAKWQVQSGDASQSLVHHFSLLALLRFAPALFFVLAVGCQPQAVPPTTPPTTKVIPATTTTPVDVTLALNWFPEAEHGGFYAALVHNYYADEGLNVTIRGGGPKVPVIADVASGTVAFGVDNADKLLLGRVQQADVVAVMAPIQDSPRCIMVHKSEGITRLEDLAGRKPFTLAMNTGQPFAQFLMKRVDLTNAQITSYPGNVAQFLLEPVIESGERRYRISEVAPFFMSSIREQRSLAQRLGEATVTFEEVVAAIVTDPDSVADDLRGRFRSYRGATDRP